MPALDPAAWRRASTYLDQALDLSEVDRAAWLADIRSQDPALADDLAALLRAHDSVRREGFLENRFALFPVVFFRWVPIHLVGPDKEG